jgi:CPA1 family monovalent cation:H+ antiporter
VSHGTLDERVSTTGIEHMVGFVPWLLLGATLLGLLAAYLRIPYATLLVIGGVATAATHWVEVPSLSPDVLLFAFLPPLLFEAAFRLDSRELRLVVRPVFALALPGTVLTALLVAAILAVVL